VTLCSPRLVLTPVISRRYHTFRDASRQKQSLLAVTLHGGALDRASLLSLHEQVTERVRDYVEAAPLGKRLPSEEELVRLYGVSRVTIRRAMDTLVGEGLLARQRGRGTFVSRPRVQVLDQLRPFVDTFKDEPGISTRLLDIEWVTDSSIPLALRASSRKALVFHRLYLSKGVPHALVRVALPESIGSSLRHDRIGSYPIYHLLEADLGRIPKQANISIASRPAESGIAAALAIEPGDQLLVVQRTTIDSAEAVLEVSTHFLRPESYCLSLTLATDSLPLPIFLPSSSSEDYGDLGRSALSAVRFGTDRDE
jgi:GntR family transcriptional regulator